MWRSILFSMMSRVSGQEYNPLWQEKAELIARALVFFLVFTVVFLWWYRKKFWNDAEARKLFFITLGVLGIIAACKYAIFSALGDTYIGGRLIMYVLPSPKAAGALWFFLPAAVFCLGLFWSERALAMPKKKFLFVLYAFFVAFTLSVNGIRQGTESIQDPLTRVKLEYSGDIRLVSGVKDFLRKYTSLQSELSEHSRTHPPGNSILLYELHSLFGVGFLGMAAGVVFLSGLIIWPLSALFESLLGESVMRRALQFFVFLPSVITYADVSLDAYFMLLVWTTIVCLAIGWSKNKRLFSFLGGMAASMSLLSNFLFLLFAPLFCLIIWQTIKSAPRNGRAPVIMNMVFSAAAFGLFFLSVYWWSGYSIIENFFSARAANSHAVSSNWASIGAYLLFAFISLTDFLFFLGIPSLARLSSGWKSLNVFPPMARFGLYFFAFLLLIGVFQGETGRLWLFLAPFAAMWYGLLRGNDAARERLPVLALLFFQIITTHLLFYTYW